MSQLEQGFVPPEADSINGQVDFVEQWQELGYNNEQVGVLVAASAELVDEANAVDGMTVGDTALRIDEYANSRWDADSEWQAGRLEAFRDANIAIAGISIARAEGLTVPATAEKLEEATERAGRIMELDALHTQPYAVRESAFLLSNLVIAEGAISGARVDKGYMKANDRLGQSLALDPQRHAVV